MSNNKKVQNNHIVGISNNILRNIEKDGEINNSLLTTIRNQELKNDGKSQANLLYGNPIWADSNPAPIEDKSRRDGWFYQNIELNDKMNLYFFDGNQETFTIGDLKYLYCKMFIDNWGNNVRNLPFLQIYTKPTGVNDISFFHSRISYEMTTTIPKLGMGEECYFFGKNIPADNEKWFSNRSIQMKDKIVLGEGFDNEEILFMALATDSGADLLGINICIQELGFSFGESKRKLELIGFINDDIIHHKRILKDYLLNPTQSILTPSCKLDTIHGNISWWAQSSGIITSNHIGVEILVSHDDILYETLGLNTQFVESQTGTYSIFGNMLDFKPSYIRLRITNNDNTNPDTFNVYLSF
jgi:hypothetical protein